MNVGCKLWLAVLCEDGFAASVDLTDQHRKSRIEIRRFVHNGQQQRGHGLGAVVFVDASNVKDFVDPFSRIEKQELRRGEIVNIGYLIREKRTGLSW